jgi:hypothetical protein
LILHERDTMICYLNKEVRNIYIFEPHESGGRRRALRDTGTDHLQRCGIDHNIIFIFNTHSNYTHKFIYIDVAELKSTENSNR